MYVATLTFIHVVISLVGIGSGFVFVYGLLTSKPSKGWTALFLATTLGTTLTGFLFPITKFTPGLAFGIITLVALGVAIPALYRYHLAEAWRARYVIGSVLSLYLNVFVGIVQAFQKIPGLRALAPSQSELPFAATQLAVLVMFVTLSIATTRRFRVAQA